MLKKTRAMIAAFVVALFLAGAVPTQAMDRHDWERKCEQRIRNAEYKLQQAIRKHGERSRQAQNRRRELEEARERCRHGHR